MLGRNGLLIGAAVVAVVMAAPGPIQAQFGPARIPQRVDVAPPAQALPPSPQVQPRPAEAARRIHRNERGRWEPDAGCNWVNPNDEDDLRVRCND
jgi:hypothetical protein